MTHTCLTLRFCIGRHENLNKSWAMVTSMTLSYEDSYCCEENMDTSSAPARLPKGQGVIWKKGHFKRVKPKYNYLSTEQIINY